MSGWPYWATFLFFFAGALARAHATYGLGRGLRAGGARSRCADRLRGERIERAEAYVARLGPLAVTLSFLTVGVQTLVNAAAGALRMPLWRYTPAAIAGSLAWAAIYTTVGFAVVEAALGRVGWWWLLVAAALIAGVVVLTRRLRRTVAAPDA